MNERGELSDTELLLAARHDTAAFASLYRRQATGLLRYFYLRTADAQTAADLTAETFAEAFASRASFRDEGGSAAAWLYGIARHQLGRSLRRNRVSEKYRSRLGMERLAIDDVSIERMEALIDLAPLAARLAEELAALPAGQADALRLRVGLGQSYAAVGPSRPSGRSGRTAFVAGVAIMAIAAVSAGAALTWRGDGAADLVATPVVDSTTTSAVATSTAALPSTPPEDTASAEGVWTFVPDDEAGIPAAVMSDVVRLGDRLFATTAVGADSPRSVLASDDFGAHWQEIATLPSTSRSSVAAVGDELLLFEMTVGDPSWRVRRSFDGVSWSEPELTDLSGFSVSILSQDGVVYAGGEGAQETQSTTDGRSWSAELPGPGYLQRVGGELWVSSGGAVWTKRGDEWVEVDIPHEIPPSGSGTPTVMPAARTANGLAAYATLDDGLYLDVHGVIEHLQAGGRYTWPLATRGHLHLFDSLNLTVRSTVDGERWELADWVAQRPLYGDLDRLVLLGMDEEGVDGLWVFTEAGVEPPRTGLASPVSQPTTTVEAPTPAPSLCTAPTPQANELHVDYVVLGPVSPILPGDILVADGEAAHVIRDGVDIGLAAEGGVVAAFHDLVGGLVVADDNGWITHLSTVGRLPSLLAQSGPPDGSGEWSIYDVAKIDDVPTAILRHTMGIEEARHGEFVFVPLDGGERWSLPNSDYYEGGTWTAQWDGEGLVVAGGGEGLSDIGRIGRDGEDLGAPWNQWAGESAFYGLLEVAVGPERVAVYADSGDSDEVSLTLFDTTEAGLTVGGFVTRVSDRDRVIRLDLSGDLVVASISNFGGTCTLVIDPINGTVSELPFGGYATVG